MAVATEGKIREEIQKKKARDFYVFVGEDPFKPDYYADFLFRAAFPEGGNREILYGDEINVQDLLEQIRTPSLWDPTKFVLVRRGEKLTAKQWEALIPLLSEPLERCRLVIQCAKADARLKFFQALSKSGEHVALVKFEPGIGSDWNIWLQSFLRAAGKEMEDSARELLTEWTAGSLSELKHSIERAALFAGGETTIRREHIRAVAFRVAPEDVFRFTAGLLSGDRSGSLSLLETLLRQGEEPLALIGLLSRQYRWLLGILAHRAEGKADTAIASAAGIFPAAGRILFPASRRLGSKGVIRGLSALAEADHGLKSSRLPKDLLMAGLVMRLTE
jgi:DNA polymerase III subunit delta